MGIAIVEVDWPSEQVGTLITSVMLEVVAFGLSTFD